MAARSVLGPGRFTGIDPGARARCPGSP